jgi:RNA recognition motif-containing protein
MEAMKFTMKEAGKMDTIQDMSSSSILLSIAMHRAQEHTYLGCNSLSIAGSGNLTFKNTLYSSSSDLCFCENSDQSVPYTLFVTNFNASTHEVVTCKIFAATFSKICSFSKEGLRNVFSIYGTPLKVERKRDRCNDPIAFIEYATQR